MSARSYEEVLGEVAELDAFIRIMAALDGPVDQVEVGRWLDRCVVLDTELARMAAEYTPGRFQKGMTIASAAVGVAGTIGTVSVSVVGAAAGPAGWVLFAMGAAKLVFHDNPRKQRVIKCHRQVVKMLRRLNWIHANRQ